MNGDTNDSLEREIERSLEGVDLQAIEHKDSDARDGLERGVVEGISGNDVIVELGPRRQGVCDIAEFDAPPKPGEAYSFSLHGLEDGLWRLSRRKARLLAAWNDLREGDHVEALVTGTNPGGLELSIGPVTAFMPASHVDLARIEDLSTKVGEKLVCEVLEVDPGKRRVVLSRRAVMVSERAVARDEAMQTLAPGSVLTGTVSRIEPFGAFVDLGGIEGLLHVSNVSRARVEDINDVLKAGQVVRVMVLEIKDGGKRIGLGMKQLEANPWDEVEQRFAIDDVVSGRVTRTADFGAFVELLPGLEGLVHVSQLGAKQRLRSASEVVKVGEELSVRIVSIDRPQERIGLSRLDVRGAVIGSDDAVAAGDIEAALGGANFSGTNLGALFKKALGDQKG